MYVPLYLDNLTDGQIVDLGSRTFHITLQAHGILRVPTGRVIACDPLNARAFPDEAEAFDRTVMPGDYPVFLGLSQEQGQEYHATAFAVLRFSDEIPVRWELATLPTEDINTLEEGQFFGYGVDAGTGCFMDESALLPLSKADNHDIVGLYGELIESRGKIVDEASQLNVIGFRSGYGDGAYPSYWGLDKNNNPLCLLTDFFVILAPEPEDSEE